MTNKSITNPTLREFLMMHSDSKEELYDKATLFFWGLACEEKYKKDCQEELTPTKLKLIEMIESQWQYTIIWLSIAPSCRYKSFPFNRPLVRQWVKEEKPWFDYQEATLALCAATLVSSPSLRQNPLFHSAFSVYASYVLETRIRQILATIYQVSGVLDLQNKVFHEIKPTKEWLYKPHLDELSLYENWLKGGADNQPGDPRISPLWCETLRNVLFAANDLISSDEPVKTWIKKARAYYRWIKTDKKVEVVTVRDDKLVCHLPNGTQEKHIEIQGYNC